METLSCREIKDHMAEILNRVAYNRKRYKIARHNKTMAILISIEEWEEIEKALQKMEDEEDIREAELALKEIEEKGTISFDELQSQKQKKKTAFDVLKETGFVGAIEGGKNDSVNYKRYITKRIRKKL